MDLLEKIQAARDRLSKRENPEDNLLDKIQAARDRLSKRENPEDNLLDKIRAARSRLGARNKQKTEPKPKTNSPPLGDYLSPYLKAQRGQPAPPGMPASTAAALGMTTEPNNEYHLSSRKKPSVLNEQFENVARVISGNLLPIYRIAEGMAKAAIDTTKAVPDVVGGGAQRLLQYPAQWLGKAGVYGAKPIGEFLERESEGAERRLGLSAIPAAIEETMKPPKKRNPNRPEFQGGFINEVPGAILRGMANSGRRVASGESAREAIKDPGQIVNALLEHAVFLQPFAANIAPGTAATRAIVGGRPLAKIEGVPQTVAEMKTGGLMPSAQRVVGELGGLVAPGEGNLLVVPARAAIAGVKEVAKTTPWTRKWMQTPHTQRTAAIEEAQLLRRKLAVPPKAEIPKAPPTVLDLPLSLKTKGRPIAAVRAHLDAETADLAARLKPVLAKPPDVGPISVRMRFPDLTERLWEFEPGTTLQRAQAIIRNAAKKHGGVKGAVGRVETHPELQGLVDSILNPKYPHTSPRTWADQYDLLEKLRNPEQWSVSYGNELRKQGVPAGDMADLLAHRITMRGMKRERIRLPRGTKYPELPDEAVDTARLTEIVNSTKATRQDHIQAITPETEQAAYQKLTSEYRPAWLDEQWHRFPKEQQEAASMAAEQPTEIGLFPQLQIKTYTGRDVAQIDLWKVDDSTGKYVPTMPGEYSAKIVRAQRAAMTSEGAPPRVEVKLIPDPAALFDPRITADVLKYAEQIQTAKATLRADQLLKLSEEAHTGLLPNPVHTKTMYQEYLAPPATSPGPFRGFVQMMKASDEKIAKLIEKGKLHVSESVKEHPLRRDQEIQQLINDRAALDVAYHLAAEMKYLREKVLEPLKGWVKIKYGGMRPEMKAQIRDTLGPTADMSHPPAMVNALEYMTGKWDLSKYGWGPLQPIYDAFVRVKTNLSPATQLRNEISLPALHIGAEAENGFPSLFENPIYFIKLLREGYQSGKGGGRMGDVQHYLYNLGLRQQGKPYEFRNIKGTNVPVNDLLQELVPNFEAVYQTSGAADQIAILGSDLSKAPPKNLGGLMDTLAIWPRSISYGLLPLAPFSKTAASVVDAAKLQTGRVYAYGMTSDLVFKYVNAVHLIRKRGYSAAEAARTVHNQFQNSHIQAMLPRLISKFIPFFTWQTFSFGKIPKAVMANPRLSLALLAIAEAEEEKAAREMGMTPAELRKGVPWYLQMFPITGTYKDEETGRILPEFARMSSRIPGGLAEQLLGDALYPNATAMDIAARTLATPPVTLLETLRTGTNPQTRRTSNVYTSPATRFADEYISGIDPSVDYSPPETLLGKAREGLGNVTGWTARNVADPVAQMLLPSIIYQNAVETVPKLLGDEQVNYGGISTTPLQTFKRTFFADPTIRVDPDKELVNWARGRKGKVREELGKFLLGRQRLPTGGKWQEQRLGRELESIVDRTSEDSYFPQEGYVPWGGPFEPVGAPMLKPGQKWFK